MASSWALQEMSSDPAGRASSHLLRGGDESDSDAAGFGSVFAPPTPLHRGEADPSLPPPRTRRSSNRRRRRHATESPRGTLLLVLSAASAILLVCAADGRLFSHSSAHPVLYPHGRTLVHVTAVARHGARSPITALAFPSEPAGGPEWACAGYALATDAALLGRRAVEVPAKHRKKCAGMAETSMMAVAEQVSARSSSAGLSSSSSSAAATRGNCSSGQITARGTAEMVSLGRALRVRYVDALRFLPEYWDPATVSVRSSDIARTRVSAQGILQGLYPAVTRARGAQSAVRIRTVPAGRETLYPNMQRCPGLARVAARLEETPLEPASRAAAQGRARATLAAVFASGAAPSVRTVFDELACREAAGFDPPSGIDAAVAADIAAAAGAELNRTVSDREYVALASGEFLREVATGVAEAVAGAPGARLRLYAAHDTTIAPVLGAFGVFDAVWPPFASHLEIEVFRVDTGADEHEFRIIYNGAPVVPRGCRSEFCPLRVLRETIDAVVSTQSLHSCEDVAHDPMLGFLVA